MRRCALLLLLCGCPGGGADDDTDDIDPTLLVCDDAVHPGVAPLHRLTRPEYRNTIRDLLGVDVDVSYFSADENTGGFASNTVGIVSELDQENYIDAADQIAREAVPNLQLPCDPSTDGEDACLEMFVRELAPKAYRRPVTAEDVDALLALDAAVKADASFQDRLRVAVTALLLSGNFLYRPEVSPGPDGLLDDYEIASRLSFFLWKSMPDAALFSAAEAGGLNTPEALTAQARRMLADPRARDAMVTFFEQWLLIEGIGSINKDLDALSDPDPMAETIDLLADGNGGWLDTADGNSLIEDDALFDVAGGELSTTSNLVNIHSHFRAPPSLDRFEYRGRMMITDPQGGIGVTFLSDYPASDRYYRLRRFNDGPFTISPHGTVSCDGFVTTVVPRANVWVRFRVIVEVDDLATVIQVRLWEDGEDEPGPQINCRDQTAERLTSGTFGVWAMAAGSKHWADLEVLTEPEIEIQAPDFEPLAASMRTEARMFVEHVLWEQDATLQTLFSAPYTFADEPLATAVYGRTDVTGPMFSKIENPPSERAGLLTLPSVLSMHAKPNQSSPVHRGAFVRERLMCQFLPPPPPDVIVVAPDPDPNATTRERYAQHTADPSCAGCHRLTDGIGFGFENYDAIGRYRTEENGLPIDGTGEVIGSEDADGPFDGAVELSVRLAQSQQVRDCAATQLFRYALSRPETLDDDCSLQAARLACREGGCDIRRVIETIVVSDSFRYRKGGQ